MTRPAEPIFNIPGVVLAIVAICALVLAGQNFLLDEAANDTFLYTFGFVPARYDSSPLAESLPGGPGAAVWTFVTYAFVHGDITHLAMNSIWFLPFGSALARRFGNFRTLSFFAATAAAGALTHLITHPGDPTPMIGASGAVSGFMAGAIRFAFQRGGPVDMFRSDDPGTYFVPAAPLSSAVRDPRIAVIALTWFVLNLLVGLFGIGAPAGESIAWETHIGAFLAGLLLFPLFDPVPAHAA